MTSIEQCENIKLIPIAKFQIFLSYIIGWKWKDLEICIIHKTLGTTPESDLNTYHKIMIWIW